MRIPKQPGADSDNPSLTTLFLLNDAVHLVAFTASLFSVLPVKRMYDGERGGSMTVRVNASGTSSNGTVSGGEP